MKIKSVLSLIIILTLISCETKPIATTSNTIEGLWLVKSVVVGDDVMTPNARWTRFNADQTQETGNGRFQHSYGTWKLDSESNELSIKTLNGVDDLSEPFVMSINQNEMIWKRTEEGQKVEVNLERATKLPETYGDELLGLWELEEVIGDGNYFDQTDKKDTSDYIFFRWDRRFLISSNKGKVRGVYNVHGHKPEVELIPYGDQFKRDFWEIQFDENQISLKLLNTDETIMRKFKRINKFPD